MPTTHKRTRHLDFVGGYQLPCCPTTWPPGSEGKIDVLTKRFEQRVSLWHPRDLIVNEWTAMLLFPDPDADMVNFTVDASHEEEADGD